MTTAGRLCEAEALAAAGRFDEAESIYCEVLAHDTGHLGARIAQAKLLRRRGQSPQALARFQTLAETHPKNAGVLLELANEHANLRNFEAALSCYRAALDLQPELYLAWMGLAKFARRTGQPEQAIAYYRRAAATKPDALHAQVQMGDLLLELSRLESAHRHFLELAQAYPDDHRFLFGLGEVARREGKLNEAKACFSRAVVLSPEDTRARMKLALTCAELGDSSTAESTYLRHPADPSRALQCPAGSRQPRPAPWPVGTNGRLSSPRRGIGSHLHARSAATRRSAEANFNAQLQLGITARLLREYARALEQFRLISERDPNRSEPWFQLGLTHREMGRDETALPCFERALSLQPDHRGAPIEIANLHFSLGNLNRAWEELSRFLDRHPDHVPGLMTLGGWLMAAREFNLDPAVDRFVPHARV